MEKLLILKIENYQKGDSDCGLQIISQFKPLLFKYSRYLRYEDAFFDLQEILLRTIKTINTDNFENDFCVIKYIQKAVYNQYIQISKHNVNFTSNFSDLSDESLYMIEAENSYEDDYQNTVLNDIKSLLTDKEYKVIYNIYYQDYSVQEIAEKLSVSRQAVNKIKISALKKLKKGLYNIGI